MTENKPAAVRKQAHPIVYMFLVLPFGISGGYVTVALGYLFGKIGISMDSIAILVSVGLIINYVKFIWAPFIDMTLSLKKWYILACTSTAVCTLAIGFFPIKASSIPPLIVIILISNITTSILGTAVSGIAAHDVPEKMKGRVSGYYNAGNLGGSGLGGGIGLWLVKHTDSNIIPVAILALCTTLCCIALYFVNEHTGDIRDLNAGKTIKNLFKDIENTLKVPMGILAMVLCFLPLGTGAASNLWAAVSGAWSASADTVEWVTGIISAFVTAGGALVGGWICDRSNKQMTYVVFGLMGALCAVGMAYSPHTQNMYQIWVLVYAFILGLSYSAFSAFVFEAIGKGAAATKYTMLASLSNFPIWYMTIVDGAAFTHYAKTGHGPEGMLDIEAACGIVGILLFLGFSRLLTKKKANVGTN